MIRIFYKVDKDIDCEIQDNMYRLRAKVFSKRLDWYVNVTDGFEKDKFDSYNPLYVVYLNDNNQVIGTSRLLKTTGSTMLRDVFSRCLPKGVDIRTPFIWESTRFAVDTVLTRESCHNGLNKVTVEMLAALIEIGAYAGLSHIVSVLDVRMERIMRRAGYATERLGDPVDYGGIQTLAVLIKCSEKLLPYIHHKDQLRAYKLFEQFQKIKLVINTP